MRRAANRGDFRLVGVDAPVDPRHQRVMGRGRPGDQVSLDQFVAQERRQLSGGDVEQNLLHCMALADITHTTRIPPYGATTHGFGLIDSKYV